MVSAPSDSSIGNGWGSLLRGAFWSFTFATTALVSASVGAMLTMMTTAPAETPVQSARSSLSDLISQTIGYRVSRPVNILVMGIDRVLGVPQDSPEVLAGRSDTMLLVNADPTTGTASILSIPRDTRVDIPDLGTSKINAANEVGGPQLAARVVSRNMDGVPIDRYVRVSTEAFRALVDLLGGVRVYVPYRMVYTDNTQKLKIDLQQGWQTLNGDQAEQFARFRHDGIGDVGRVQRQQQLIRALQERLTNPAVLPKIPQIIQLLQTYIDTNLTLNEMLALANFGMGLNQDNFRMVMLPGRFSTPDESVASYWIMDPVGRDRIMQDFFRVNRVETVAEPLSTSSLRIAVQNSTGDPQRGAEMATYLRQKGFNNVYVIDDWSDSQTQTQIIAQRGDLQSASRLQRVLGTGRVVPASIGDLDSDLTIRVGNDWVNPTVPPTP